jgi:hypothetical protein
MATVLNTLGQDIIPDIFSKLQGVGLVDTMTIKRESASTDSAGGQIKGTVSNAYTSVPVDVKPKMSGSRFIQTDTPRSMLEYELTFPTHDTSSTPARISIDVTTDRLVVDARGNEPARTFRILSIANEHGVDFVAICEKED